jgi:predicted ester cyclase
MRKLPLEHIAREYYDLFNARRFDEAELLVSSHAGFHYPHTRETLIGRAGYRELVNLWMVAFPDAEISIVDMTVRGSRVVVNLMGRGTHKGPLTFGGPLELEPTGRRGELAFSDTLDIQQGQIVESWLRFDIQAMLDLLKSGGPG